MDLGKTGNFIAQLRREHQLTQQQLADKLNITGGAVSKWERGLSFPDVSMLEPLAETLGVNVSELMRGERNNDEYISANDAEQNLRDAINLISSDLEKSPFPEWLRRFFGPDSWLAVLFRVLFLLASIFGIMGILFVLLSVETATKALGVDYIISAFILVVIGMAVRHLDRLHHLHNEYMRRSGNAVYATITRISQHYFTSMPFQKNSSPYYLKYEYTIAGRAYRGRSPLFWQHPQLTSKAVQVYIDPDHPNKSYLDLAELGVSE